MMARRLTLASRIMVSFVPNHRKRNACGGFTLLELLLTLGILLVMLSIAVPTYDALVVARRIQTSADALQLNMQKARMKAIESGQAQVFRMLVGENQYTVQPWLTGADLTDAGPGATIVTETGLAVETDSRTGWIAGLADASKGQHVLEEGVVIASAQTLTDSRNLMAQQEAGMGLAVSSWSAPIVFYPDGSSTTAEILLQDARGQRRSIRLRGLTGKAEIRTVLPSTP